MRRKTLAARAFDGRSAFGRLARGARFALTAAMLLQFVPAPPASAQARRPAAKRTAREAPEPAATPEATPTPTPTPEPKAARPQQLILRGAPAPAPVLRRTVEAPASSKTSSTPAQSPAPAKVPAPTLAGPLSPKSRQTQPPPGPYQKLTGELPVESITPESAVIVSFEELSRMGARKPAGQNADTNQVIHSPGRAPAAPPTLQGDEAQPQWGTPQAAPAEPNVPSPSPSQSFLAQEDSPKVGTGSFTIPPDTMGAVGLNKVFTQANNNFRIHDKLTGAPLSTVSADSFWAPTGGTGVFDPRIVYDPYNNRWITCITSNAQSATSSVLVGVSTTSDPQGTWLLFRVTVGAAVGSAAPFANGGWADFPMLGFNKNFVAIGYNMFSITSNAFIRGEILVLRYPSLRAGTISGSRVNLGGNFCVHPATTLSGTEDVLYALQQGNAASATLVAYTITAPTPTTISVAQFGLFTRPGGGWVEPFGDLLPQNCVTGSPVPTFLCPATPRKLEVEDSQMRNNVVFRNGRLWYVQTVGIDLPGGDPIDHTAAQWTAVTPTFTPGSPGSLTMTFNDGGRVEDPTATATNGGSWYSYPSIAVNRNNDVLLGYSEFESDDFVDAAYSYRSSTDAAGTMRDPVVYKEGEDYYQKVFSGSRNRWGDYSHTVVDPVNDTDLWTVQEYAGTRVLSVPPDGLQSNDSRWSTWWAKLALAVPGAEGDLVISEFRLRGPGGAEDEYVELHNRTESAITVTTTDGSAGYALAASDGVIRHTIPNGTVIPARGHYLIANTDGYSLGTHPAGPSTTATPDGAYTENIPDNGAGEGGLYRGIALFNTANTANFNMANRLDAAGPTAEANALYREGAGYTAIAAGDLEQAWVRDNCGKQGNMNFFGPCPSGGFAVDNDDNAADFYYVEVTAAEVGAGKRLGAPGPENLSSPVQRNDRIGASNLDPAVGGSSPPNRDRTFTADAANNSTFGTLIIRRTFTNNSGVPVTRLRFRVIDVNTNPPAPGNADLRARTSSATPAVPAVVTISGSNPGCPAQQCTVQQTTLETPPAQPFGGGFNSTLSVGTVTVGSPILPGAQVNVQFLLGIQQTGRFRFYLNIEALP